MTLQKITVPLSTKDQSNANPIGPNMKIQPQNQMPHICSTPNETPNPSTTSPLATLKASSNRSSLSGKPETYKKPHKKEIHIGITITARYTTEEVAPPQFVTDDIISEPLEATIKKYGLIISTCTNGLDFHTLLKTEALPKWLQTQIIGVHHDNYTPLEKFKAFVKASLASPEIISQKWRWETLTVLRPYRKSASTKAFEIARGKLSEQHADIDRFFRIFEFECLDFYEPIAKIRALSKGYESLLSDTPMAKSKAFECLASPNDRSILESAERLFRGSTSRRSTKAMVRENKKDLKTLPCSDESPLRSTPFTTANDAVAFSKAYTLLIAELSGANVPENPCTVTLEMKKYLQLLGLPEIAHCFDIKIRKEMHPPFTSAPA